MTAKAEAIGENETAAAAAACVDAALLRAALDEATAAAGAVEAEVELQVGSAVTVINCWRIKGSGCVKRQLLEQKLLQVKKPDETA